MPMSIRYLCSTALCFLLVACGTPSTSTPAVAATTIPSIGSGTVTQPLSSTITGSLHDAALLPSLQTLATGATAQIVTAALAGNKTQLKQATDAFEATWSTIEDGVKSRSPASYRAIEQAMGDLQDVAVRADTIKPVAVQAKGAALTKALNDLMVMLK